jgi:hypothetical protein
MTAKEKKKVKKKKIVTIGQRRLARETIKALYEDTSGKVPSQASLLKKVGYNPKSSTFLTEGYRVALMEAMQEAGITENKVAKKINELLDSDNHVAMDKGITHTLKIAGAYAPTKTQTEHTGTIEHTLEADEGDYADFIKSKNRDRIIEEGVILEEE